MTSSVKSNQLKAVVAFTCFILLLNDLLLVINQLTNKGPGSNGRNVKPKTAGLRVSFLTMHHIGIDSISSGPTTINNEQIICKQSRIYASSFNFPRNFIL